MRVLVPEKKRRGSVIIRNVDLTMQRGTSTLIIGTSGAGKSTLIGCMLKETYRFVRFDSNEFPTANPKAAYIRQHPALNKKLTAREAIYYSRRFENLFESPEAANKKTEHYIEMLGLKSRENNKIEDLSGGQQQRVAIAKELIRDAKILIADEIDTGLDCGVARNLARTLTGITREQNLITIVISHNVENIPFYDQIVVLAKDAQQIGGVAYQGVPKDITQYFQVSEYADILTQVNLKEEGGNGLGGDYIDKNLIRHNMYRQGVY